jgi:hypothetical protein
MTGGARVYGLGEKDDHFVEYCILAVILPTHSVHGGPVA